MIASMLPFWKMQAIGNDFPLVHLEDVAARLKPDEDIDEALSRLALSMCDRHFGIGGDGLLAVSMEGAYLRLRMFNPDGTEDFCGNGLRCAAIHGFSQGWVEDRFTIKHLEREVPADVCVGRVTTVLGTASYAPADVPLAPGTGEIFDKPLFWEDGVELVGSVLSTGSTHAIIPVNALPGDEEFFLLSPRVESFPLFPARTSVIWTQVLSANHLRIRIWERGVGETLGCGTGSSAAVADHLRRLGRGGHVLVDNPGGRVEVTMASWQSPIQVEGSAEQLFKGMYILP